MNSPGLQRVGVAAGVLGILPDDAMLSGGSFVRSIVIGRHRSLVRSFARSTFVRSIVRNPISSCFTFVNKRTANKARCDDTLFHRQSPPAECNHMAAAAPAPVPLGGFPVPLDTVQHILKFVKFKDRGKAATALSTTASAAGIRGQLLESFCGGGQELFLCGVDRDVPDPRFPLVQPIPESMSSNTGTTCKPLRAGSFLLRAHRDGRRLRGDVGFLRRLVVGCGQSICLAGAGPRSDRQTVLVAAKTFGRALCVAAPIFRNDKEVVVAAVTGTWQMYDLASAHLRGDVDVFGLAKTGALAALAKEGWRVLQWDEPGRFAELKADRDVALRSLDSGDEAAMTVMRSLGSLRADKTFFLHAIEAVGYWPLSYASDDLKEDRDVALAAVTKSWHALRLISPVLQADRDVARAALTQDWQQAMRLLDPALRHDRELMAAVCAECGYNLRHLHRRLQKDRAVVLAAVQQHGTALKWAAPELKKDREIVLAAVRQTGWALQHADAEMHKVREIVLAAVTQTGVALWWAEPELKKDREIVLAAVKENWAAFQYADPDVKWRDVGLAAVKANGRALQWAHPQLANDREIVMAAIDLDGCALRWASPELKTDRELVLAAVKQNGRALEDVDPELKKDREIVLAAINENGLALRWADQELKKDREIVVAAFKQNWSALMEADPLLRNCPSIWRSRRDSAES